MSYNSGLFKRKRIKLGISQKELATKLGYTSSQFISNWERGVSSPPPRKLIKIAKILDIDRRTILHFCIKDYELMLRKCLNLL